MNIVPTALTSIGKKSTLIQASSCVSDVQERLEESQGSNLTSISHRHAVEEHKPHDKHQYDDSSRSNLCLTQLECRGIHRDERESHCNSEQASRHAPNSRNKDSAASPWVHSHGVDPGHDKVGSSDDETDSLKKVSYRPHHNRRKKGAKYIPQDSQTPPTQTTSTNNTSTY